MSLQVQFFVTIDHPERVWISQSFVSQQTLCEDGEISVRVGRHSGETRVGEQGGCHQPAGKEMEVWDTVGHPVVDRAEGSGKAGSLFLSWAMALLCAVDAWEETPYHYSIRTSLPPHGNP